MTGAPQTAVLASLAFLQVVHDERIPPRQAQERLATLRSQHPDLAFELVWEEEAFDHSIHYDLLISGPDRSTISLGLCADDTLPWPLRGVRRWTEANLVQVNGRMITMEDAIDFIDIATTHSPIRRQLIEACILREEFAKRQFSPDDQELQEAVDALRRSHGVHTAAETEAWMKERGMTHQQLEYAATSALFLHTLKSKLADERGADFFAAHRGAFAMMTLVRIECPSFANARRVVSDLQVLPTAETVSSIGALLDPIAGATSITFQKLQCGRRHNEFGDVFREATAGDIFGPVRSRESFIAARVLSVEESPDFESSRRMVADALLEEWLAERQRTARITWHWGRAHEGDDASAAC